MREIEGKEAPRCVGVWATEVKVGFYHYDEGSDLVLESRRPVWRVEREARTETV
jgi:hypothetical protein